MSHLLIQPPISKLDWHRRWAKRRHIRWPIPSTSRAHPSWMCQLNDTRSPIRLRYLCPSLPLAEMWFFKRSVMAYYVPFDREEPDVNLHLSSNDKTVLGARPLVIEIFELLNWRVEEWCNREGLLHGAFDQAIGKGQATRQRERLCNQLRCRGFAICLAHGILFFDRGIIVVREDAPCESYTIHPKEENLVASIWICRLEMGSTSCIAMEADKGISYLRSAYFVLDR